MAGKFHENLKSERVEFDRENIKYVEVLEEVKVEYIQGDPNQNFLFSLIVCISDPKMVKPKYVLMVSMRIVEKKKRKR